MHSNRLQLNPAKTEILGSAISRRLHQLPQSPLRIGTNYILPASVVRDLGVYTDCDVSMRTHVTRTVSACFAVLRQLRSIRGQCRGPFSSRSCRHLLCLDWTSATRPGRHPSASSSAAPIRDECSCLADFSVVKIRPRNSGSSSAPLAEGSWTDWLQTRRPRIQMPAWVGTAIPHRRTLPTSWSQGSTATALGLFFITDCPPKSTLHCR